MSYESDPGRITPSGESLRIVKARAFSGILVSEKSEMLKRIKDLIKYMGFTQAEAEDVVFSHIAVEKIVRARATQKKIKTPRLRTPAHGRIPWGGGGKERVRGAKSDFELLWNAMNVRIPVKQQKELFTPRLYDLLKEIRVTPALKTRFYSCVIGLLAAEHRKKLDLGFEHDVDEDRETLLEMLEREASESQIGRNDVDEDA